MRSIIMEDLKDSIPLNSDTQHLSCRTITYFSLENVYMYMYILQYVIN